jgi:hypothetical protein
MQGTGKNIYICCAWRLQNCNRSPLTALPSVAPRPLRWRYKPALRHLFFPSEPQPMWRRCGPSQAAGRPAPAIPRGDASAPMPPLPSPADLAQRATDLSFRTYPERQKKCEAVVSGAPAASGRTSSRSRCLAHPPPATARRAAPNTFRIWGFQEGGEKNGDGKRPDWAASRRKLLGN